MKGGEKMAGNGRPPVKNPKNVEVKIRISDTESEMLEYCMKEMGANRSEVMRKGLKKVYDEIVKQKYKRK